ncbi:MAG: inositol monophosphatase [Verrucomicrobiales bacterium]|nr:inositol monophosphatase [Verrucomicrobiales bacterium]
MKTYTLRTLLAGASDAARDAGALMRRNLLRDKRVNEASQHDIKLELDVRCQKLIERALHRTLPEAAVFGEEGTTGDDHAPLRWVVDPIDGTVNFTYGIPHACVSIALQLRDNPSRGPTDDAYEDGFRTLLGVIYDPFTDELWSATDIGPACLNGKRIAVASRSKLEQAIVAMGFAKHRHTLDRMLPVFQRLVHRVRKIRITGSAALSFAYVATGRFDAYVESGVRLWDIAAGGLILQRAGGVFWRRAVDNRQTYEIVVSAKPLQRVLHRMNAPS